jgi:hypothetical protein
MKNHKKQVTTIKGELRQLNDYKESNLMNSNNEMKMKKEELVSRNKRELIPN